MAKSRFRSGTDFSYMFKNVYDFNKDIGSWDVSNGAVFNLNKKMI